MNNSVFNLSRSGLIAVVVVVVCMIGNIFGDEHQPACPDCKNGGKGQNGAHFGIWHAKGGHMRFISIGNFSVVGNNNVFLFPNDFFFNPHANGTDGGFYTDCFDKLLPFPPGHSNGFPTDCVCPDDDEKNEGKDNGNKKGKGNNKGKGKSKGKSKGNGKSNGKNKNNGKGKGKNKGRGKNNGNNKGHGKNNGKNKNNGKGKGKNKNNGKSKGKNKGRGKSNKKNKGRGKNNGKSKGKNKGRGNGRKNGPGYGKEDGADLLGDDDDADFDDPTTTIIPQTLGTDAPGCDRVCLVDHNLFAMVYDTGFTLSQEARRTLEQKQGLCAEDYIKLNCDETNRLLTHHVYCKIKVNSDGDEEYSWTFYSVNAHKPPLSVGKDVFKYLFHGEVYCYNSTYGYNPNNH